MDIKKTVNGNNAILKLSGRLDTTTSPQLQAVLIPVFENVKHVELNMDELEYVSSAGLRVLLMGEKTASAKSAVMIISGASEAIMEVFEITGFSDVLTIV